MPDAVSLYNKHVENAEEWQYALDEVQVRLAHGRFYEDEQRWVTEDDERSASYKAAGVNGTGEIRTRNVRTVIERYAYDGDDSIAERTTVEKTNWVVKTQTLVA